MSADFGLNVNLSAFRHKIESVKLRKCHVRFFRSKMRTVSLSDEISLNGDLV